MLSQKLRTFFRHPVKAVQHRFHVGMLDAHRAGANRQVLIHDHPLFVLGNQRSGAKEIVSLLSQATGKAATVDLDYFNDNYACYDQILHHRLSFKQFLEINRLEFSRPIIKESNLTHFYPELRKFFPLARYLTVIRDPRDNLRSILERFDLPGDQPQLNESQYKRLVGPWPLVFDGSWLGLLGDNYIEMLALRWALFAEQFLAHTRRIVLCRYEDFLEDKIGQVHRLAQCLGLLVGYDIREQAREPCMAHTENPTDWLGFFGKTNLEVIHRICGPTMAKLGYQLNQTKLKRLVCPRPPAGMRVSTHTRVIEPVTFTSDTSETPRHSRSRVKKSEVMSEAISGMVPEAVSGNGTAGHFVRPEAPLMSEHAAVSGAIGKRQRPKRPETPLDLPAPGTVPLNCSD